MKSTSLLISCIVLMGISVNSVCHAAAGCGDQRSLHRDPMDIAVASVRNDSAGVAILHGGIDGHFTYSNFYRSDLATDNGSIATADFNGDEVPDIVMGSLGNAWPQGMVSVALGNGSGGYGNFLDYPFCTTAPLSLAPADFGLGDDVHLDLVVGRPFDGIFSILQGDGTGGLTELEYWEVGTLTGVVAGDFDGDDWPDLAVSFHPGGIAFFMNNGHGTFPEDDQYYLDFGPDMKCDYIATGDFNCDGHLDLVAHKGGITMADPPQRLSIFLNDGTGDFRDPANENAWFIPEDEGHNGELNVGDYNGDMILDVARLQTNSHSGVDEYGFVVCWGDGTGAIGDRSLWSYDNTSGFVMPEYLLGADLNGDGVDDLALLDDGIFPSPDNYVRIWLSQGSGGSCGGPGELTFVSETLIPADQDPVRLAAIGNVNISCNSDIDCDGIPNPDDICMNAYNPGQEDEDLDGIGDTCDQCPGGPDHIDSDGDGVCDALDLCEGYDDLVDANGNSNPDACDLEMPPDCEIGEDDDSDGWCNYIDCNDYDPRVSPEAAEVCDTKDNNCNGGIGVEPDPRFVDEYTAVNIGYCYPDGDGDGFGARCGYHPMYCGCPEGTVRSNTDCDDCNPAVGECPFQQATHPGSYVQVDLDNISVTFDNVTEEGDTEMMPSIEGPVMSNLIILPPIEGLYYHISSSASFSGNVEICVSYDELILQGEDESTLTMQHWNGASWNDITFAHDEAENMICGVSSTLSPFVLAVPVGPYRPLCEIVPDTLDFGAIAVGDSLDLFFTISNVGNGVMYGSVDNTCPDFSIVSGGGSFGLEASESLPVTVRFKPTSNGIFDCTIETGTLYCGSVFCTGIGGDSHGVEPREDDPLWSEGDIRHRISSNPFRPTATIEFMLPAREAVKLAIYDVRGKLVTTLVENTLEGGPQEFTWNGRDAQDHDVSPGVYFYRLTIGRRAFAKKMVLVK
ncbi:FG-GAP-like repeat-containing protein, partial [Candidatus Eisenbacteria bacterium]